MSAQPARAGDAVLPLARLLSRFLGVRRQTEALCQPLVIEDFGLQAMPDVSPPKWHLAHTTWFFEQFLLTPFHPGYTPFHPQYALLFNSYYESLGRFHPRPQRGLLSRPTVNEIQSYRAHVDALMLDADRWLERANEAEFCRRLELGLHHEQQHQELILTDLKYNFSVNPLRPAYGPEPARAETPPASLAWQEFPAGLRRIGHHDGGFAFDNEGPAHSTYLAPFALATRLVTWGEYQGFMADDGYRRPEFWLSEGWRVQNEEGWTRPLYLDEDASLFTLGGMRPLDPNEPVSHLSYFEADAYARYAGCRLPTEAEWEVAAAGLNLSGNFCDTGRLHPAAASPTPELQQMFGDVWEWTQSAYSAYPGYRPETGALGEYNGKFMCGQFVLRGGSCATPAGHIRASYRNFFPPSARWQFSGLRLARDL